MFLAALYMYLGNELWLIIMFVQQTLALYSEERKELCQMFSAALYLSTELWLIIMFM